MYAAQGTSHSSSLLIQRTMPCTSVVFKRFLFHSDVCSNLALTAGMYCLFFSFSRAHGQWDKLYPALLVRRSAKRYVCDRVANTVFCPAHTLLGVCCSTVTIACISFRAPEVQIQTQGHVCSVCCISILLLC